MFGTVRPAVKKISDSEQKIFRSYYCGLCSALGDYTGFFSRLGLSYDITFAFMILDAGRSGVEKNCFCPANPIRKKNAVQASPLAKYLAAVSVILMYEKCVDNQCDGDHRFVSATVKELLRKGYSKIRDEMPETVEKMKTCFEDMRRIEAQKDEHVAQKLADAFGKIVETVFGESPIDHEKELYARMGYHIGRWIYIVDAATDLTEDAEKNRFNPFLINSRNADEAYAAWKKWITQEVFDAHDCIMEIIRLLDIPAYGREMENIFELSLSMAEGRLFAGKAS